MLRITIGLILCASAGLSAAMTSEEPNRTVSSPIRVAVSATDVAHRLFRVSETILLPAGTTRLIYPKSLPGMHGALSDPSRIAGLAIRSGGKALSWRRSDAWTIELLPSTKSREIRIDFDLLAPLTADQGQIVFSNHIVDLQWGSVLLLAAADRGASTPVETSLTLPEGWSFASALPIVAHDKARNNIVFQRTSVASLIDSPVMAGAHAQEIELSPGTVRLTLFSEAPTKTPTDLVERWKNLVRESDALFGQRPFQRYVFLVALSDKLGGLGLEHAQSAEIAQAESFFRDALSGQSADLDLLAHEYVHAWNGKQRIPRDLSGEDYQTIRKSRQLWVYEGLTQYLDWVLAARSGLFSSEQFRALLAERASELEAEAGRRWRPLADIVHDEFATTVPAKPWPDWQRGIMDLYDAGALLWLDVDVRLRQCSEGRRSLDDFVRILFAPSAPKTYARTDIEKALGSLCQSDWRSYFSRRIDRVDPSREPGIEAAGWKLSSTEEDDPQLGFLHREGDFRRSAGIVLADSGQILSVSWQGPAFSAGLRPGLVVARVGDRPFSFQAFADGIAEATRNGKDLPLAVADSAEERRVTIAAVAAQTWPILVRKPDSRDWLSEILRARRK